MTSLLRSLIPTLAPALTPTKPPVTEATITSLQLNSYPCHTARRQGEAARFRWSVIGVDPSFCVFCLGIGSNTRAPLF